jgi:hypothetical protein
MKIKDALIKVAGPLLAEKGFEFVRVEAAVRWVFARQVGDIEQYIVFQKSHYFNGVGRKNYIRT